MQKKQRDGKENKRKRGTKRKGCNSIPPVPIFSDEGKVEEKLKFVELSPLQRPRPSQWILFPNSFERLISWRRECVNCGNKSFWGKECSNGCLNSFHCIPCHLLYRYSPIVCDSPSTKSRDEKN